MIRPLRFGMVAAGFAVLATPIGVAMFAEAARSRTLDLLTQARRADETVDYQGRRVVSIREGDGMATTWLDFHVVRPGYRVTPVRHVGPDGKETTPGSRSRGMQGFGYLMGAIDGSRTRVGGRFRNPSLILENYRLVSKGTLATAGRSAEQFELIPHRAGRSRYRFALDGVTRLMLAFEAVAPDGRVAYESKFESIRFDPDPMADPRRSSRSDKFPRSHDSVPVTQENLRALDDDFAVWRPAWLPSGFVENSSRLIHIEGFGDSLVASYSDGMTWLFVAQVQASNAAWNLFRSGYLGLGQPPPENTAQRILHPGGAMVSVCLEGTEVLIAGQTDPAELEKIAQYLTRISATPDRRTP